MSAVTCAVLAIGVLVIRSTTPGDDDLAGPVVSTEDGSLLDDSLISIEKPGETRPAEYITLEPSKPEPRPLPPTEETQPSEPSASEEGVPPLPQTVRRASFDVPPTR